eukprot:Skav235528  [mRNA]  locus=scaffold3067:34281:37190:+ [translate_table: standard]
MVAGWEVTMEESMKGMVPKMARSIAGKKLPPVPPSLSLDKYGKSRTSIMLFYQYVEPAWTPKQHRRALTYANHYEAEIGHFQPPKGGAEFIDPKAPVAQSCSSRMALLDHAQVRNSHELPKWLGMAETQEWVTRHENPEFQTEGEFMLRGGIERYGKNFLFDKRQEQIPENKPMAETEKEAGPQRGLPGARDRLP